MIGDPGTSPLNRALRVFLWGAFIAAVLFGLTYLILAQIAGSRGDLARTRWAEAGLPITEMATVYPTQEDSPAALELDACCARLGISLRTNDPEKKAPEPEGGSPWAATRGEFVTYLGELEKAEPATPAPPEPVSAFLSQHAATLQEIRDRLARGGIRWSMHIERGFAAEIPSLLGHLDLTRLLLADTLAEHAGGRDAKALADIQAAWDLSSVIEPRPELISQFVCIAMRTMSTVALRKLDGAPAEWDARLASWDPEAGILRSYAMEAYAMGTVGDAPSLREVLGTEPRGGFGDRLTTFLGRPFIRLCLADTQRLLLDEVQLAQKLGPCAPDSEYLSLSSKVLPTVPRWNLIAAIALPNLSAYGRVKHLRIQLELTRKVLALKAARANSGKWPPPDESMAQSFCPGERWVYEVTPDGGMSLTFSGPPAAKELVRTPFPQEYREEPPKGGKR